MKSKYRVPAYVRIGMRVIRPKDGQRAKIDRLLKKLEKAIDRGEMSSFEKGDIYNELRAEYKQTYKRTMTLSTLAHQLRIKTHSAAAEPGWADRRVLSHGYSARIDPVQALRAGPSAEYQTRR